MGLGTVVSGGVLTTVRWTNLCCNWFGAASACIGAIDFWYCSWQSYSMDGIVDCSPRVVFEAHVPRSLHWLVPAAKVATSPAWQATSRITDGLRISHRPVPLAMIFASHVEWPHDPFRTLLGGARTVYIIGS